MGYYSSLAIDELPREREYAYPSRRKTLQYYLEDLKSMLEILEETRPHDPMNPNYDYYFYSDCTVHYYGMPGKPKVEDVLFAIREVSEQIKELEEAEKDTSDTIQEIPGQIFISVLFWNGHCAGGWAA